MIDSRRPEDTGFFPKRASRAQAVDTGMALALICVLLGLFRHRSGWIAAAAALLVLSMTFPGLLKPAARVWFGLTRVLGAIMSRLLLTLVFFLVVTPVGRIRRAMGKDSLRLRQFKLDDASVFLVRTGVCTAQDLERPY